jgi:hypothetical protein
MDDAWCVRSCKASEPECLTKCDCELAAGKTGRGVIPRTVRVVSVHVGDTDWVPMQAAKLKEHLHLPFRLYATANDGQVQQLSDKWQRMTGSEPAVVVEHSTAMEEMRAEQHRCILNSEASCDHGLQLHYLLSKACRDVPAEDVLLVLDSDAWPIANVKRHVLPLIDGDDEVDMVAVRRSVEGMALWPHPSYAVTTCRAWARAKRAGDWCLQQRMRTDSSVSCSRRSDRPQKERCVIAIPKISTRER